MEFSRKKSEEKLRKMAKRWLFILFPSVTFAISNDPARAQVLRMHTYKEKYESAYFADFHRQCKETNFGKILRKHFVETTEIEIAENSGELVQLDAGKTIVNLVLRKV